jgi:hypothetical protein
MTLSYLLILSPIIKSNQPLITISNNGAKRQDQEARSADFREANTYKVNTIKRCNDFYVHVFAALDNAV